MFTSNISFRNPNTLRCKYYATFALSKIPYDKLVNEEHTNLHIKSKKEKRLEHFKVIV